MESSASSSEVSVEEYCSRVEKYSTSLLPGSPSLYSDICTIISSGGGKQDKDLKKCIVKYQNALDKIKTLCDDYGHKGWFGKLIKKKKKKKSIEEQLKDIIADLQKGLILVQLISFIQQQGTNDKTKSRKVLWVDDNPENNKKEAANAKKHYGIDVVQKISTKEAMDFLHQDQHKSLQKEPSRIISDLYREGKLVTDSSAQSIDEGENAGLNLIKWLRIKAPICIYCSNPLNVLNIQSQFSDIIACSTASQLDLFFSSMLDTPNEASKEEEEEDNDNSETEPSVEKSLAITSPSPVSSVSAVKIDGERSCRINSKSFIGLQFYDSKGNPCADLKIDEVTVALEDRSETLPVALVATSEKGYFTGTYSLKVAGSYQLSCYAQGNKVGEEPFIIEARRPDTDSKKCIVSGTLATLSAALPVTLTIQTVDITGAKQVTGGDVFTVLGIPQSTIHDNSDGSYTISLQAAKVGTYNTSAASPAKSFLTFSTVDSLHCGQVHSMGCTLLDSEKNVVTDETLHLEATLTGPKVLDGFITKLDGSFLIEYFPTRPGKYTVSVTLNGKEVSNSGTILDIKPPSEEKKKRKANESAANEEDRESLLVKKNKVQHRAPQPMDDTMPTLEFTFHVPKTETPSLIDRSTDLDPTLPYNMLETKPKEENVEMTLPYEETNNDSTMNVDQAEPTIPYEFSSSKVATDADADLDTTTELQPTIPMEFTPKKHRLTESDVSATVPFEFDTSPPKTKLSNASKALFSDSSSDTEEDSMYKIE